MEDKFKAYQEFEALNIPTRGQVVEESEPKPEEVKERKCVRKQWRKLRVSQVFRREPVKELLLPVAAPIQKVRDITEQELAERVMEWMDAMNLDLQLLADKICIVDRPVKLLVQELSLLITTALFTKTGNHCHWPKLEDWRMALLPDGSAPSMHLYWQALRERRGEFAEHIKNEDFLALVFSRNPQQRQQLLKNMHVFFIDMLHSLDQRAPSGSLPAVFDKYGTLRDLFRLYDRKRLWRHDPTTGMVIVVPDVTGIVEGRQSFHFNLFNITSETNSIANTNKLATGNFITKASLYQKAPLILTAKHRRAAHAAPRLHVNATRLGTNDETLAPIRKLPANNKSMSSIFSTTNMQSTPDGHIQNERRNELLDIRTNRGPRKDILTPIVLVNEESLETKESWTAPKSNHVANEHGVPLPKPDQLRRHRVLHRDIDPITKSPLSFSAIKFKQAHAFLPDIDVCVKEDIAVPAANGTYYPMSVSLPELPQWNTKYCAMDVTHKLRHELPSNFRLPILQEVSSRCRD